MYELQSLPTEQSRTPGSSRTCTWTACCSWTTPSFTCKNPADSAPSFGFCGSFANNCKRLPRTAQTWAGLCCVPPADLLYMPFLQWSELKETRLLYWLAGGLRILEDLNHKALLQNRVQRAREHIPAVVAVLSALMSFRQKDTSLCVAVLTEFSIYNNHYIYIKQRI